MSKHPIKKTDITSPDFDVDVYLSQQLREKSLDELVKEEEEMVTSVRRLDSDIHQLVYENYNKFLTATNTVRKIQDEFNLLDNEMDSLGSSMKQISDVIDDMGGVLCGQREDLAQLGSSYKVVRSLQFIFDLPSVLTAHFEERKFSDIVRISTLAKKALHKYKDIATVAIILEKTEKIIEATEKELRETIYGKTDQMDLVTESLELLLVLSDDLSEVQNLLLHVAETVLNNDLSSLESISADVLDMIDKACGSFIPNLTLFANLHQKLFPKDKDVLLKMLTTKLDEFYPIVQKIFLSTSDPKDCSIVVRALDRYYRKMSTCPHVIPGLDCSVSSVALIKEVSKHEISISRQRIKDEVYRALVEAADSVSDKTTDVQSVAIKIEHAFLFQVKTALANLLLFIASDVTFSSLPHEEFQNDFAKNVYENLLIGSFKDFSDTAIAIGIPESKTKGFQCLLTLIYATTLHHLSNKSALYLLSLCKEQFALGSNESVTNSTDASAILKSSGHTLIQSYSHSRGLELGEYLLKQCNYSSVTESSPTGVTKVVKNVVEQLDGIDRLLQESFGGDSRKENRSRRLPDAPRDSLWCDRIDFHQQVHFNRSSMLTAIVKIMLKSFIEYIRLDTYSKDAVKQIQVDCCYFQRHLAPLVSDEVVVNSMVDQALSSALKRCIDPVLIHPSKLSQICNENKELLMERSKSLSNIVKCKQKYRGRSSAKNRYNGRRSKNSVYEYEDDFCTNNESVHFLSVVRREDSYSRSDDIVSTAKTDRTNENNRYQLQNLLQSLLKTEDDSNRISKRACEGQQRFLINGYDFVDILWLTLKTYLSDLPCALASVGCADLDKWISETRKTKCTAVINSVLNFQVTVPISKSVSSSMNSVYLLHIIDVRKGVIELLDSFDKFSNLFPNTRSMKAFLMKTTYKDKINVLEDRLNVLNAWLNTVNDLNDKIEQFRTLFRVGSNDPWPKNLDTSDDEDFVPCPCIKTAKQVFRNVVRSSLSLKGMKKLLGRVSSISDVTITKTSAQFMKRVKSYAEAADKKKADSINLSDSQKVRFQADEAPKYGTNSILFGEMQLPTYVPFFKFLVGIKMELILEWLAVRHEIKLENSNHQEPLILEAIMEDCRDCVEETILSRKNYAMIVNATGDMFCHKYEDSLDESLLHVYTNYLNYLSNWSCAISDEYADLWSVLENEWTVALRLSRYIYMGLNYQSSYFLSLMSNLFEKCVVSYFETANNTTDTQRSWNYQLSGNNEAVQLCREYNRILTNVQKRSQRICALLQTISSHLQIASGYEMSCNIVHAVKVLQQNHYLIETDRHSGVALVVDEEAMSTNSYDGLCLSLYNCSKIEKMKDDHVDSPEPDRVSRDNLALQFKSHGDAGLSNCSKPKKIKGYLMVIPDPDRVFRNNWSMKRLRTQQEEELVALRQLRTDIVCVIGTFGLNDSRLKKILKLKTLRCSTYENIDSHISSAQENLLDQIEKLWKSVTDLKSGFDDETDIGDNVITMFRQAFNTMFQLHRETYRVLAETGTDEQQKSFLKQTLSLVNNWVKFVKDMNNDSSNDTDYSMEVDLLTIKENLLSIPVWSRSAFNFFLFLVEKCSNLMTDRQFESLQIMVKEYIQFVGCRSPGPVSARQPKKLIYMNNNNKGERIRPGRAHSFVEKVKKLENEIANKNQATMGKVLTDYKKTMQFDNDRRKLLEPKWHVLKLLGKGATAEVFTALHLKSQKLLAVKIMKHMSNNDPTFRNEVEVMKRLDHQHLVKYIDHQYYPQTGESHLAMELCFDNLATLCEGPIAIKDIRTCTNSLLQAVVYLHERSIVHRDIKPANIYFDKLQQLKLGDFGVSISLRSNKTMQGEIMKFVGTPSFMAPEVVTYGGRDEKEELIGYGRAVDVWSVGCVLLNMITSEVPWKGYDSFQLRYALGMGNLPNMKKVVNEKEKDFLSKCLVSNPALRKKAAELLKEDFVNLDVDYESTQVVDR
ncbi:unnamed protein product [Auanema sp. JU1783]|nr:unnamed protein product [Auanema sp. JU1783]